MNKNDVRVIAKQQRFKSYVHVDSYLLKHRLFDGGWSDEMSREVLERGHAAAVLLYDPDLDLLVLIEQFRAGAFAALADDLMPDQQTPWLIECVAGIIEAGESPQDVVRREAVEEAGCVIEQLTPLYHYYSSPGCLSESVFLFCGRVDAANAGGIHGLDVEHEDIRVFTATPEQAWQWLQTGRINNAMTMLALQWFRLNHDSLRRQWLRANDDAGS